MAKPPASPPSKDEGTDRGAGSKGAAGAAEQQDTAREQAAGRPPQTKR